jgi:hypothetical protein
MSDLCNVLARAMLSSMSMTRLDNYIIIGVVASTPRRERGSNGLS